MTVISLEPGTDLSGFDPAKYNVYNQPQPEPSEIPLSKKRDELFLKAGLNAQDVKGFDEFAKDILYMQAKHRTFSQLAKKYPAISPAKLARLQVVIGQNETGKR